ncbi:T9SS type A sorting domain-containing protein [Hymenobacter lucidus]|uniref:T9SS type A sorting domain-containing protein n=1 Tax=Hymenobacter lucidus TaxID=2880930 RepID=A0ABS8AVY4_9BACT|nr:T9SS type A sorting domain-containing protein [Hymenobacter lucidus]MCB2409206.1 T9SS type A sorting domain-containing protein [Hymenobacter lucidus]
MTLGVATGSYEWQQQSSSKRPVPHGLRPESEEEEDDEEKRPDRPDLAQAQEAALTRDPATGTIPRERLLIAQQQIEQMLEARASQRAIGSSLSTANWTEKGPSNIGGRVRAIMVDPSDATGNKVWAGSVGGGLWKSNNAAATTPTWTKVNDTFTNLAVTTIAYDPTNPDIMYFGTGEGFGNADNIRGLGIWKSTDHGATWNQLSSTNNVNQYYYINRLAVDKNGWVYAATNTGGLRRSKDQGATWTQVLTNSSISDVDVNPTNGTVYATSGNFTTGGGIFRSASGDLNSFINLRSMAGSGLPTTNVYYRVELAIAPSDPTRLYALYCGTDYTLYGIYRTSDGGNTWQSLPEPDDADTGIAASDFTRGQGWYDLSIGVSPTDPNTVFIGGIDIFKTSNGGAATASSVVWQQTTHWYGGFGFQNVHADQHAVAFAPGSGSIVYFGNDGGVARSLNATATIPTITHINTNFNVTQFYAVAVHPTDYSYFLAGAQDNGTQQFRSSTGTQTRDVNGGDGAFCAIDEETPDIQFATYVYSNVYRSRTKGDDFFPDIIEENDNAGSFINPLEYDSRKNRLYYNYGTAASPSQLRRVSNATGTPRTLATIVLPSGSGTVTHIAISPNVTNRVYVGTSIGRVIRIDSAATTPTFTTLYTSGTSVSVSGIAIERSIASPEPDQHMLTTFSNYGTTSVLQTTNGGTNWASAEGNLPDMPVRWVLFDPTGGKRAMIATELGVWTTDDLTATSVVWQPANTNFANVRVDMLRLRKTDKTVVAATHGRGLFTSNVFIVNPLPVQLASFTGQATDQGVALRWKTASELNASRFEIERAAKGAPFQVLGSKAAAGNSTTARSYAYLDENAAAGTYAYRLHQIDVDGSAAYSPVVTVTVKPSAAPLLSSVYPNPFVQDLTVMLGQVAAYDATVILTDMQGRVVHRAKATPNSRLIQLHTPARLSAGAYLLTVQSGEQKATRQVIIKP